MKTSPNNLTHADKLNAVTPARHISTHRTCTSWFYIRRAEGSYAEPKQIILGHVHRLLPVTLPVLIQQPSVLTPSTAPSEICTLGSSDHTENRGSLAVDMNELLDAWMRKAFCSCSSKDTVQVAYIPFRGQETGPCFRKMHMSK